MTANRARLADAARLLPVAGTAAILLPDVILSDPVAAEGATVPWLAYLFAAWVALIGLTAWLARAHARAESGGPKGGRGGG